MKPLQDMISLLTGETRTYTLYLIRHGEACHNIMEKQAADRAMRDSAKQGLDDSETKQRMEEARKSVLDDPSLFDAPLSARGKDEARKAHDQLLELQQKFPRPSLVFVSPLQRTLQTANLAFPKCGNIHVREQLRERITGYACDSRHTADFLMKRKSFQHFSMHKLRTDSIERGLNMPITMFENLELDVDIEDFENDGDNDDVDEEGNGCIMDRADGLPQLSSRSTDMGVEEKIMLRERTKLLFPMLLDTPKENSSIAVVTHKGYLRELERGQFGIEGSPLFGNGEVRVYEVKISKRTRKLLKAKRLAF